MSKNKLLALAVAAAFAAPAAFALDVNVTTPDVFPNIGIANNTTVISNGDTIEIAASSSDNYLGRSTGYNIRVTLGGGAQFAVAVDPADVAGLNGETVTIAGGGNVGDTSVTFAVEPATNVIEGDGIEIAAGAFSIRNVGFLSTAGSTLAIDVRVGDPVGGSELAASNGNQIASSLQPWNVTFTASTADQRVDVGAASAKRFFGTSTVGSGAAGTPFHAGNLTFTFSGAITQNLGVTTAASTVDLNITGVDFSAFEGGDIYLSANSACGAGTSLTINSASDTATVTGNTVATHQGLPAVCFVGDDVTQIAAQGIGGNAVIKQTGLPNSPTFTGNLASIAYNGIVKIVSSFNPASNPSVDSLLRVINTSAVTGLFTIEGRCQNGSALTPVTFTLASNNAVQYSSAELESGNAGAGKPALSNGLGTCPAGRSRLVVTGEVGTAEVQNFLRSSTSAGVITAGHNNQD